VIVDLSAAAFIDSSVVGALFRTALSPGPVIALAPAPGTMARRLIDIVAPTAGVPIFGSRQAITYCRTAPGAKEGA